MRKTYHVAEAVSVAESIDPDTIILVAGTEAFPLTKQEWRDLCSLLHTATIAEPKPVDPDEVVINKTRELLITEIFETSNKYTREELNKKTDIQLINFLPEAVMTGGR